MKKYEVLNYIIIGLLVLCIVKINSIYSSHTQVIQIQKPQTPTPERIYIPLIAKSEDRFWDAVQLGAERAANDYRLQITFEAPPSERDIQVQDQLIEEAIIRNPQALAIAAIDAKGVVPFVEEATSKGIPVIAFDSGIDSDLVKTTVSTDNYAAGQLAAHKMASLIKNEGKVALIVPDNTSETSINRTKGFVDTIAESYPNIEVVAVKYGEGDVQKSAEAAKEIIAEHPDIKGIFAANEGSTQGLVIAANELGLDGNKIKLIGFDAGRPLLYAIKNGVVAGAITQDPVTIGYRAVVATYRIYKGESVPVRIDTGFRWYDRTNMDNLDLKAVLYE